MYFAKCVCVYSCYGKRKLYYQIWRGYHNSFTRAIFLLKELKLQKKHIIPWVLHVIKYNLNERY